MAIAKEIEAARGLVSVYTEDGLLARIRAADFRKHPLERGESFDEDAWQAAVAASQEEPCRECALDMLERSDKSSRALRQALVRKGYLPGTAEKTAARLEKAGLVDDARLAQRLTEGQAQNLAGRYAIRRRLMARGISPEDAEEAVGRLSGDQQAEAAKAVARRLADRCRDADPRKRKSKVAQGLARRGFGWDEIEAAMDGLFDGEEDET